MSNDSSDEENLDHLKEATDASFFDNSLYNGNVKSVAKEIKVESKPSLRIKDEYDQFRLFNVTPQFQKYVGNALSEKIERYLKDNLTEHCHKKRKKKIIPNHIKLLSSSKYPIEVDFDEKEVPEKKQKCKPEIKNRSISISESDFNSIVISGEEILSKKETEYWSNRSKAPVYNYVKSNDGVLRYVEPEFK